MMERERGTEGSLLVELLVGTLVCLSPAIALGRLDSQTMGIGMILASVVVFPAEFVRHFGVPQWFRDRWRDATVAAGRRSHAIPAFTMDDWLRAAIVDDLRKATRLDFTALSETAAVLTRQMAEFEKRMAATADRLVHESNAVAGIQEELRRQVEQHDVMLREAVERMSRLRQDALVLQQRMRPSGLEEALSAAAVATAALLSHGTIGIGGWWSSPSNVLTWEDYLRTLERGQSSPRASVVRDRRALKEFRDFLGPETAAVFTQQSAVYTLRHQAYTAFQRHPEMFRHWREMVEEALRGR